MSPKKPTKKRNVLGRGLGALLEDSSKVFEQQIIHDSVGSISDILISNVEANPFQPRSKFDQESLEELADSILVGTPTKRRTKTIRLVSTALASGSLIPMIGIV